jgi:hypothetical protein
MVKNWCSGRDLNPHRPRARGILNPLCLPIPPPEQNLTLLKCYNEVFLKDSQYKMKTHLKRIVFFLILTSLVNCTRLGLTKKSVQDNRNYEKFIVSSIQAKWFKRVPSRFMLLNHQGLTPRHLFFDVNPAINLTKRSLNFVVSTPSQSEVGYNIDLKSGQHYSSHKYCDDSDIWKQYSSDVELPPFSVGIVPRVFDQIGEPQKIIVFGDDGYFQKHFKTNHFDGNVVGGYVEQICPKGACLNRGEWRSRLVLVAIDPGSEKFGKVANLDELSHLVDMAYVKAFIQNGFGTNVKAGNHYATYRMGSFIEAKNAMTFFKKNSIFFTVKKLTKMRKSCYKLYDHVWKKLGQDSKIERLVRTKKTFSSLSKLKPHIQKSSSQFFYKRFISTFKKYQKSYSTCEELVYPANVNHDQKRFWFFSYYTMLNLLNKEGYTYDCNKDVWKFNSILPTGKKVVSLSNEFKGCHARNIDKAFSSAAIALQSIRNNSFTSYRFIDYDRGALGTHSKLFSWVPVTNKRYRCAEKKEHFMTQKIFPHDIKWKKRELKQLRDIHNIF